MTLWQYSAAVGEYIKRQKALPSDGPPSDADFDEMLENIRDMNIPDVRV